MLSASIIDKITFREQMHLCDAAAGGSDWCGVIVSLNEMVLIHFAHRKVLAVLIHNGVES